MKRRLDRLVETHPESPFTYTGQAIYQFMVKGRLDEALRSTLQAVAADPNDTQQRVFVSYHLDTLGDQAASGRWLDSAFALQPDNAEAKANTLQALGIGYRRLGQVDEALDNLKETQIELRVSAGDAMAAGKRFDPGKSLEEIFLELHQ